MVKLLTQLLILDDNEVWETTYLCIVLNQSLVNLDFVYNKTRFKTNDLL